ncbi:hypothetical protein ABIB00_006367 [Bradyrhizobium sp. LB14.3]
MSRPALEVVDIFRDRGPAWRQAHAGHVSLDQLKVMSAIENCRTAAVGGHVAGCEDCAYTTMAYNFCRNRHCPKCQGAAAKDWLADREAELLPVPYYHVVFTLPAAIADIAYQNKTVIYNLLFKASAARIGITSVLHTWGSALTHHPHVHMICRAVASRPTARAGYRAVPASFSRCACSGACTAGCSWKLIATHKAGRLYFFGNQTACTSSAIKRHLAMRKPSRLNSHRCATPNGWSMPSVRSAVPRPCWPICRAIHTASPSPTAA